MRKLAWIAAIISPVISSVTFAENNDHRVAFEIDPATFALNGYSLHVRVSPESSPNVRFGVGIYSLEFPQIFVDINPDNKDGDWDVKLKTGIGLFGEYFLDKSRTGWFVGTQIAGQKYDIEDNETSERTHFKTALVMPYGGYKWDVNENLYLTFWGGIGLVDRIDGDNHLVTNKYDISPTVPYGAVHIGYQL